jgi:hypothetical protein
MLQTSKLLAGVLIAVSATAVFPVIVRAGSTTHLGHTSSCHHDFPVSPAPTPTSHQCCVSGHQWAVPGSAVTLRCVVAERVVHAESRHLQVSLLIDGPSAFLSHSPPVHTSLRI